MARILSIDYGLKRTGLAVTDPLQIIASALETVETKNVLAYIKDYHSKENLEAIVIGLPKNLDNSDQEMTLKVNQFIKVLETEIQGLPIYRVDERFSSKIAFRAMVDGNMKKKDRRDKSTIDKISATIILQSYLDSKS